MTQNSKAPLLDADYLPSLRTLGIITLGILLPSLPLFAYPDGPVAYFREYWGMLWHFAMFFLIAKLPAPSWGRIAGFAWIILDILSGVLALHHMPADLCWAVRLSAHLFEGLWMMSAALVAPTRLLKICFFFSGFWLHLYTWLSPVLDPAYLALNSPFFIATLVLLALGKYDMSKVMPRRAPQPYEPWP